MATLLHIDSSALPGNSVSRELTAAFAAEWRAAHPEGTVIHRDLAAAPVPHLGEAAILAAFVPADQRTAEQQAAFALREELLTELEQADAVVIGTPMYNFSVPSALKAWIDHVVVAGRTLGGAATVAGKPVTVLAARGGGYGPGSPREEFEFTTTYLEKALTGLLGVTVDTVATEFTLARINPAMAEFIDTADELKAQALKESALKGRAAAEAATAA
ncbi:FMN-dependent NADH-azoreductase [Kitasatospora viridis]|uniref:FMN dependent NADH:quinone oxidoreductase n=1 Tax=Kitasatospora viridis TaxID=281105 RepID=A0A561UHJ5_9ACTN|nr:NAD(P)H-dependent oxidoreductase [Kitasatospora viridis]TWF98839.1 FMN-dependent NADH-azoreductase [Kitasatospora viridis]